MLEAHHVTRATRGRARGTRRCGCGVQLEGLSGSTGRHFVGEKVPLVVCRINSSRIDTAARVQFVVVPEPPTRCARGRDLRSKQRCSLQWLATLAWTFLLFFGVCSIYIVKELFSKTYHHLTPELTVFINGLHRICRGHYKLVKTALLV